MKEDNIMYGIKDNGSKLAMKKQILIKTTDND